MKLVTHTGSLEMYTDPRRRREYYQRTNYLIQQNLYIDKLLDSSLPNDLLNDYGHDSDAHPTGSHGPSNTGTNTTRKVKRTPKDIYRSVETTPLISASDEDDEEDYAVGTKPDIPWAEDDDVDSGDRIVTVAIYVNFAANAVLLAGKILIVISASSVSVLASLVDAALDFLSTAIVWATTWLISHHDQYRYPVGRRR